MARRTTSLRCDSNAAALNAKEVVFAGVNYANQTLVIAVDQALYTYSLGSGTSGLKMKQKLEAYDLFNPEWKLKEISKRSTAEEEAFL